MQNLNYKFRNGRFRLSEHQEILIRNRVSALPLNEKLAIYFLYWEQYSFLKIARNLGVAVVDVSNLIQNARARLRRELGEIADIYFGTHATTSTRLLA